MRRLYLSETDSKIFGVCGGIGESYDVDPTLVRLIMVLLCLTTAILPVAITYLVGWIVIPKKPN
jgi:phage shock protein PspC (stress-responsive transcriptional regulator)